MNCNVPQEGIYGSNAPSGITFQNVVDCPYPGPAQVPPCFPLVANEWLTFQAQITVGTWDTAGNYSHPDSTFKLWAAREGQSSVLIIACPSASPHQCNAPHFPGVNYFNRDPTYKIGKLWLLPYMTLKSPYQPHATAYTWYDEVVIATALIADPVSGVTPTAPTAPSGFKLK